MSCYHPLKGYKSKNLTEKGNRKLVFKPQQAFTDLSLEVPCGQCIGCRLERSRQWAVRIMHESKLYDDNCFLTLTYNDKNLPADGGLNVVHFQKFMKRLRKKYAPKKIRFYHAGEYGDDNGRPHYHACLFNINFQDKTLWKKHEGGSIFISDELDNTWQKGFATIGELTFNSAAYVARYITKKQNGAYAKFYYESVNRNTGEIIQIKPEYSTMSRRPGIGKAFFDEFKEEIYPDDFIIINGQKTKPPKFYDKQYELINEDAYGKIKDSRIRKSADQKENQTWERLKVREACARSRLSLKERTI